VDGAANLDGDRAFAETWEAQRSFPAGARTYGTSVTPAGGEGGWSLSWETPMERRRCRLLFRKVCYKALSTVMYHKPRYPPSWRISCVCVFFSLELLVQTHGGLARDQEQGQQNIEKNDD